MNSLPAQTGRLGPAGKAGGTVRIRCPSRHELQVWFWLGRVSQCCLKSEMYVCVFTTNPSLFTLHPAGRVLVQASRGVSEQNIHRQPQRRAGAGARQDQHLLVSTAWPAPARPASGRAFCRAGTLGSLVACILIFNSYQENLF